MKICLLLLLLKRDEVNSIGQMKSTRGGGYLTLYGRGCTCHSMATSFRGNALF